MTIILHADFTKKEKKGLQAYQSTRIRKQHTRDPFLPIQNTSLLKPNYKRTLLSRSQPERDPPTFLLLFFAYIFTLLSPFFFA